MKITKREVVKYTLPASWASYLINGDDSGINSTDKAAADKFHADKKLPGAVSCGEESSFSWRNDADTMGGEVLEFSYLIDSTVEVASAGEMAARLSRFLGVSGGVSAVSIREAIDCLAHYAELEKLLVQIGACLEDSNGSDFLETQATWQKHIKPLLPI